LRRCLPDDFTELVIRERAAFGDGPFFTAARMAARWSLAIVRPSSFAFRSMLSQPALLSHHDPPTGALTSSEEYGSMASGIWTWLATARFRA
jgi:hypothetical protein